LDPTILEKFLGDARFFEEKFILSQLENRRGLQRDLYERSLNGLEYLAQLKNMGLDPIFKGGSAVQLLLPEEIQRLSIDLDLAVDISELEIVEFLKSIHSKFNERIYKFEPSNRKLPSYYRIYYVEIPSFFSKTYSKLELDFLLHTPHYQIQEARLKTFLYDSEITVKIPTVDSLIGDKLTVLAPRTIGKPMQNPLQYSKQLYDIASLFAISSDINMIYNAYLDVFEFEKLIRNLGEIDLIITIDDLISICKLYSLAVFKPDWITDNEIIKQINFLKKGIENLYAYTSLQLKFTLPRARTEASKIGFLGGLLKLIYKKDLQQTLSMKIFHSNYEPIYNLYRDSDYMNKVIDKISNLNQSERSHIFIKEFMKTDPLGLLYWYGYYYPFDFLENIL